MPYRIDITNGGQEAFDRLIDLGALDAELSHDGTAIALMPDQIAPERAAGTLDVSAFRVSAAVPRDAGSVWILRPRPIRAGGLQIAPADAPADGTALRLLDDAAFGTGLHPTTALCLEALGDTIATERPSAVLDIGTGSGVLALAALMMGVPEAVGIDIEVEALRVAGENARLNGLAARFQTVHGGPEIVSATWPLVVANVLAAPLIDMAPTVVRRVGHHGHLVLSGIPSSVEQEVDSAYCRLGMQRVRATSGGGWVALVLRASW